jgi:ketosteroid isomerase-like protein
MDTRSTVTQLYQAYRAGDAETVASMIHDDIDWVIHGPAHLFPFEGPRRGKAAVLETLAAIGRQFALKRHDQTILVIEGERAAVISDAAFVQRATGRLLVMQLVNFLRVVDGKIVEFREFSDTFDTVEQAVGLPLVVPAIAV